MFYFVLYITVFILFKMVFVLKIKSRILELYDINLEFGIYFYGVN